MTSHSRILLALMSLPKIGPSTARKIVDDLKYSVKTLSDFSDVVEDMVLGKKLELPDPILIQSAFQRAQVVEELSYISGIRMVSIFDEHYPEKLKRLRKPPVLLHYIGDLSVLKEKRSCAVIGTRNPSQHGFEYGVRFSKKLAEMDFDIISGLALGCDTAGHKGCLEGNGKTTAVLAQGLNPAKIYPKENRELAKQIVETGGLLLSEYAIDEKAQQSFFIERDRIQAGLSDFVFVIETGLKGGTWHTINFALESKIPVGTYNHPEKYRGFEQALGNQQLIAEQKATGIYSLEDLDAFISKVYAGRINVLGVAKKNDEIIPKDQRNDSVVQAKDSDTLKTAAHQAKPQSQTIKLASDESKSKKKEKSKGVGKKRFDSNQTDLF